MHQPTRLFKLLSNSVVAALLLTFTGITAAGTIVATIKPVYSLLAQLTVASDNPVLLMKQPQSPHHYTLRPSERRLLADAEMIIWIGPQMESFLSKVIRQQKNTTTIITLIETDGLKLLDRRSKHSHQHEDSPESVAQPADKAMEHHDVDPHIWLATDNAITLSKHITQQLIALHPENSRQYQQNLQQLLSKIESTRAFITDRLKTANQAFIAYHDAFHYFEHENNLNYIDSVNYSDETGTSLKHMRQIKARIEHDHIGCLVYQAPKPALVDKLVKMTSIRAIELDPLGSHLDDNKDAWFDIMRSLAKNFSTCLQPSADTQP